MLENLFLNEWSIWFSFVGESTDTNENYHDNISLIYTLKSPADLAYVWNNSPLSSLSNYFARQDIKQNAYLIKEKWRKVNSIECFKKGIEPKWEDPLNAKGGRFIFSINKGQQNKEEIYQNLIFYLIGESYEHSQKINGFRFISSKNPNTVSFRIEIWVSFNNQDQQSLEHFKILLKDLFDKLNYETKSIRFNNNESSPAPAEQK